MTDQRSCCWVLTGPTASGKTSLSIRIAKAYHCEIICMDSMQIYRGMDIGTAKPTVEEMDGIPHHMLNIADPRDNYSVAQYQQEAEQAAQEILQRGHQPLFVGGTGLYLRALRHPMAMGTVAADDALRDALQAEADAPGGKEHLHAELAKVDPATAERLPLNDVRRVIRALEVYKLTGIPFSQQEQTEETARFRYRVATLTMDRAILYARIEQRVDQMLQDGLLQEIKGLLDAGVPRDAQAMKAIGYKELIPVLMQEQTLEEAVPLLKQNTRHYAKRQLTWMRREEDVCWVDSLQADAYGRLTNWYTQGAEDHDD
jgi:tRNA dimethylallyltransferase